MADRARSTVNTLRVTAAVYAFLLDAACLIPGDLCNSITRRNAVRMLVRSAAGRLCT